VTSALPVASACEAPSLQATAGVDARDSDALERCQNLSTGSEHRTRRCGRGERGLPLDQARLAQAAPPLDSATRKHVQIIARRGKENGRRLDVFGLVGDSMTVSSGFMRGFSSDARSPHQLAPALASTLMFGGATIVDHYRGVHAAQVRGVWRDSFGAPRAARIGARAEWSIAGGHHSALARMVRAVSPAVAVVLYGGNDAAARHLPPEQVADHFGDNLERVIDALERRGVVPVLNTVARHGRQPGVDDCGPPAAMTNWRIAVHTNAVSARAAEIACRRKLPLIDLRHALDGALNRGLGHDGVHLSAYGDGAALLTPRGLACGENVRNYVTLKMLREVVHVIAPIHAR